MSCVLRLHSESQCQHSHKCRTLVFAPTAVGRVKDFSTLGDLFDVELSIRICLFAFNLRKLKQRKLFGIAVAFV